MTKLKKTQCELVLDHLRKKGSITPAEALFAYSCARLAARVHELKERGCEIHTELKHDSTGTTYARYWLVAEPHTPKKRRRRAKRQRPNVIQSDLFADAV